MCKNNLFVRIYSVHIIADTFLNCSWPEYSWLDRTLMALFLIICHFVVV